MSDPNFRRNELIRAGVCFFLPFVAGLPFSYDDPENLWKVAFCLGVLGFWPGAVCLAVGRDPNIKQRIDFLCALPFAAYPLFLFFDADILGIFDEDKNFTAFETLALFVMWCWGEGQILSYFSGSSSYYDYGDGDTETMTYEEWWSEGFLARVILAPFLVGFVTVLIVGIFGLW